MADSQPAPITPAVQMQFDQDCNKSPAIAIVEAVAAAEGSDPMELDVLYERVDAEGLNQILTASDNISQPTVSVQFIAAGRLICARDDGTINVYSEDQFNEYVLSQEIFSAE